MSTPEAVIAELRADDKRRMIACLREELDPPINASQETHVDGETYIHTFMSNAWVAVYREENARFHAKTIIIFDLIDSGSALYKSIRRRGW